MWLDRTCEVNLGFNKSICEDLTNPHNEDYENKVQEEVSRLNIVGRYIGNIPSIIMTLLLGNSKSKHDQRAPTFIHTSN